jgi:predicted nucleotidyltransferase
MGRELGRVAERLACSERTLRRCINDGLLRGRRLGPRSVELPWEEQRYAETHWDLLQLLRAGLRTERSVRLAVLFGSAATGEDTPESDVDVLAAFDQPGGLSALRVATRLRRLVGRRVDVVTLTQARDQPSLLADALEDGRVLIDRDGVWASVIGQRDDLLRRAAGDEAATAARAGAAVGQARARLE